MKIPNSASLIPSENYIKKHVVASVVTCCCKIALQSLQFPANQSENSPAIHGFIGTNITSFFWRQSTLLVVVNSDFC